MDSGEQDYHNFSTPSSHRLPTVSGAEAIRNVRRIARPIPTSLTRLDEILGRTSTINASFGGGVQRGFVTEIFGPPGVGKTTFALQIATNALHASGGATSVTWIDTSSQLVLSRLKQLTKSYRFPQGHEPPSSPPVPTGPKDSILSKRFHHLTITSLPKLLTLFLYPTTGFPLPNTSIVVLDDLSNLILSSLPRSSHPPTTKATQKSPTAVQDAALAKRALSRRFQVLSSLASALQKFAATNNVAILVTSKATVNLKNGQKAVLRPALTSQQWDNYLSGRIALFRDFWPEERSTAQRTEGADAYKPTEFERRSLRFAKVIRLGGKLVSSPEVGFVIEQGGLRQVDIGLPEGDISTVPLATQALRPLEDALDVSVGAINDLADHIQQVEDLAKEDIPASDLFEAPGKSKRKAIEIADSEEESDNGSDEEDETLLPPAVPAKSDFQSSSQVHRENAQNQYEIHDNSTKKSRIAIASSPHAHIRGRVDADKEDDEMLLERYEKEPPPFSQAAAEMSEPLTPSDDGRDVI